MKARFISGIAVILTFSAGAQTFQNFNFEMADLPGVPPLTGGAPFSQAFPQWQGYITNGALNGPVSYVLYNDIDLAGSNIGIYDYDGYGGAAFGFPPPIAGNFSAYLQADGGYPGGGNYGDPTIAQTSLIPVGTQSLLFKTTRNNIGGGNGGWELWEFIVRVNGQSTPFSLQQDLGNALQWGANISGYAGTTAEIAFSLHSQPGIPWDGTGPWSYPGITLGLDDIELSTLPIVPEPSVTALLSIGALAWAFLRKA